MFIIIVIAVLLGVWRHRSRDYFKWIGITFLWMLVGTFLFSGGGTLEDPTGDGLIIRQIRVATEDGPAMGFVAIALVITLWGGIIYFLSRAARAAKAVKEADEAELKSDDLEPVEMSRKALETVAILAAAAGWFYFNFSMLRSADSAPPPSQEEAATQPLEQRTIEQEVMGLAAEINAATPQRIDNDTTLVRGTASGRTLTYHYELEPRGVSRKDAERFLVRSITPRVCAGKLRPSMKEYGITYAYSYTSDDFAGPVVVTVNEQVCENLGPTG